MSDTAPINTAPSESVLASLANNWRLVSVLAEDGIEIRSYTAGGATHHVVLDRHQGRYLRVAEFDGIRETLGDSALLARVQQIATASALVRPVLDLAA